MKFVLKFGSDLIFVALIIADTVLRDTQNQDLCLRRPTKSLLFVWILGKNNKATFPIFTELHGCTFYVHMFHSPSDLSFVPFMFSFWTILWSAILKLTVCHRLVFPARVVCLCRSVLSPGTFVKRWQGMTPRSTQSWRSAGHTCF